MTRPLELCLPPSERLLRAQSPVRAWLARRRGDANPGSGLELLEALVDPASDWVDRAVGYTALGDLALSTEERAEAYGILAQALQRPPRNAYLLTRLGRFVVAIGPAVMAASFLMGLFVREPVLLLGFAGTCVLPLLFYIGSETLERRRHAWVQRSAAAAQLRLGAPDTAQRTKPSPLTLPQETSRDNSLRMWRLRRALSGTEGSSTALLQALATPCDNRSDHVLGLRALLTCDLSPFERTQAGHRIAKALLVTGVEGNRRRRFYHAAALAHLVGLGIGAALACIFSFQMRFDLPALLGFFGIGCIAAGIWTVFTTPLFFLGLLLEDAKGEQAVYRAAVDAAAAIGGPECIAALHEHRAEFTPVRIEASNALRQVLPRVTSDWYGRLPANALSVLRKMAESSDENIACLAIDAIGRAGGGNCAAPVAHLAQHAPSREVRKHAEKVLPMLIERRRQEDSSALLLRAGQQPDMEHLLHPLHASALNTAELLQMASAPETGGGRP